MKPTLGLGPSTADPVEQDAAFARAVEAGHQVEDGALAAPGRPDDGDELAGI